MASWLIHLYVLGKENCQHGTNLRYWGKSYVAFYVHQNFQITKIPNKRSQWGGILGCLFFRGVNIIMITMIIMIMNIGWLSAVSERCQQVLLLY